SAPPGVTGTPADDPDHAGAPRPRRSAETTPEHPDRAGAPRPRRSTQTTMHAQWPGRSSVVSDSGDGSYTCRERRGAPGRTGKMRARPRASTSRMPSVTARWKPTTMNEPPDLDRRRKPTARPVEAQRPQLSP